MKRYTISAGHPYDGGLYISAREDEHGLWVYHIEALAAIEEARHEERAKIVACLRRMEPMSGWIREAANAIERGEHMEDKCQNE